MTDADIQRSLMVLGNAFDKAARTSKTKQHAAQHIWRVLMTAGFKIERRLTDEEESDRFQKIIGRNPE